MERLVAWPALQAVAHQVAVEEDGGGAERRLRQLEHHADLQDEVDALSSQRALFFGGHAVEDGRCLEKLLVGKNPLLLGFCDGRRWGAQWLAPLRWGAAYGGGYHGK